MRAGYPSTPAQAKLFFFAGPAPFRRFGVAFIQRAGMYILTLLLAAGCSRGAEIKPAVEPPVNSTPGTDIPTVSFELEGSTHRAGAMVFSPDLQWFAAWRLPDQLEVWNVAKASKATEWTAGPAGPWSPLPGDHSRPLAFLDDRRILVASATNVAIHDLLSGKTEQILDDSGPNMGQLSVSKDGRYVAGVTDHGEFSFWSLPDGHLLPHLPTKRPAGDPINDPFNFSFMSRRTPPAYLCPGTDWEFSQDGNILANGRLCAVDAWDLRTGKWLSRYSGEDVPEFRIGGPSFGLATTVAFLSSSNLALICGGALAVLHVESSPFSLVVVTNPAGAGSKERLKIRALSVSADGTRLALAGMRMAWRRSDFNPGLGGVFDVSPRSEIQVWNTMQTRLLVAIRGRSDEKFSCVALDAAGKHVAAVTIGASYTFSMEFDQAIKPGPTGNPLKPYRVVVWNLP